MYDLPIVPPPVHMVCVLVEEAELDEVFHSLEEVSPMTYIQSQIGYGAPMMMMPTFGAGYCDYEVGPSSSYMDVGLSTFYMHGHKRGHGEHNKYMYYEAPVEVLDRQC